MDIINSTVISSYLRNLLLRLILDGAFICSIQRICVFKSVQVNSLFDLQADLLWEVWNSNYRKEFSQTCSQYFRTMFSILEHEDNPIRTLYMSFYSENNE